MDAKPSFISELKRRNVVRMAGLYLVGAWLLTQVASTVLPMFGTPDWLPRTIVILLAIGFLPALIFSWVFELTPEGLKRDAEVAPEKSIAPQTARRMDRMIIVVLLLALGYFAFDKFVLGPRKAGARNEPPSSANSKSIAVLPLVNTSGDPGNEYFSDGLSEELIAVLAKIPELKVIGRGSSFFFKGKSGDSAEIGQKLGVAHLIEGSVRKQGDRVRIVAELIRAADGRSLWSETYDRELKDVFAVQAEIARSVAEQMKVKLLGGTVRPDAAGSSENPAAHNAVLQADFYFQQQTAESMRQAIKFLEAAVRLDPNYALAYAKLAQAWRQYAASFSTDATDDTAKAYNEARRAADMAVSLAPDLVETRMAVGLLAVTPDLDFRAAEKEFQRVLALAPSDAAAKNALGMALVAQGRGPEAERTCLEAISLDPLLTASWYNIGRVVVAMGRYKEAEELFRRGIEIQPHASRFHSYLVILDILQSRPAQAAANAQLESEGFWRDYAVNLVEQAQGDRSTADAILKDFIARYPATGAFQIAVLYAVRREPDEMFKWLDKAYATRDSGLTQLAATPFFLPYVNDPRFAVLSQKLNVQLPSYTREAMSEKPSFFSELKRRNVVRMAGLYLVGAWLLTQVASTVLPMFGAPDWLPRSIVILLAIGFLPALIFSWIFEVTPEGLKRDADVPPEKSIAPQTARRMDRMIIAVLLLALGYFAFDKFVLTQHRTTASTLRKTPDEKSVAVLAFANLSDDKGSEYFSDGISEELLTVLQKIPGLHVAARTSAFSFKGKNATAQEIGEKLGVTHLVDGSVRKSGDVVRIAARLTQAGTGEQQWSENYTRNLKDVFAVQTELAQTIVEQLRGQLTGGAVDPAIKSTIQAQVQAAEKGGTRSAEAHESYLKGRFFLNRHSEKETDQARAAFERAVELDPKFALAWAGLAQTHVWDCNYATEGGQKSFNAHLVAARDAVERALALEPDLPDALYSKAMIETNFDYNWKGAAETLRKALALAPQDPALLMEAGNLANARGEKTQAIEFSRRAVALDPVNAQARAFLAGNLSVSGHEEEARGEYARVAELNPSAPNSHAGVGLTYLLQGKFEEAATSAQKDAADWARLLIVSSARWAQKRVPESDAALAELIANTSETGAYQIAEAYGYRNDKDHAFEWLERARRQSDAGLPGLRTDALLPNLHDDPRWNALLRSVGLADDQLK